MIRDRYEIIRVLGEGKFGKVLLAKDHCINKTGKHDYVAIKCDNTMMNLLKHEATMLNYLHQRSSGEDRTRMSIPRVVWFGIIQTTPLLVTPYYAGGTLTDWVNLNAPVPLDAIAAKIQEILDTLACVHRLLVVHRDLKPDNFLLTDKGRLVLVDFGLATFYVDGHTGDHIREDPEPASEIVGSPMYASLNVHLGIRHSRRDDCIQAGYIALYMGLQGHLPWENVFASFASQRAMGNSTPFIHSPTNRIMYLSKKNLDCSDPAWTHYMKRCYQKKYSEEPDYVYVQAQDQDVNPEKVT